MRSFPFSKAQKRGGIDMQPLEETLGYTFRDPALLDNALTHSSYANENRSKGSQSNERLEFLGDSVLGMVTAVRLEQRLKALFPMAVTVTP